MEKIWQIVPKCIWWKVWTTRNDGIFNSMQTTPLSVANKIKFLITESACSSFFMSSLSIEVNEWLGNCTLSIINLNSSKLSCSPHWRICCIGAEFLGRWKKSSSAFFYGAFKGNPGTSRAGG